MAEVTPNNDSTVGQVINEVGGQLANVTADAQDWGDEVKKALQSTPGASAPQPVDPTVDEVAAPDGSAWAPVVDNLERPDTEFTPPTEPESYELSRVSRFDEPTRASYSVGFTDVFSTYEPGAKPSLVDYTCHTVVVPDVDDAPEITAPTQVTLEGGTAPRFGGIRLPSFAVSINPATLPSIGNTFDYTDDPYSQEILGELTTQVRSVLGGNMLVPRWVWDGVWSRGVGNIKREEQAAARVAQREHASAGWMMPGPVLLSRRDAAAQKVAESLSELTRENTTQQAMQVREDLWKSIETGMAIETLLVKIHDSARERTLKAAVEANNAGIAVYNAAVQAYQITEIQAKELLLKVKDLELRGELAELEAFDRELKRAGFLIEYDKNQVELYKAQWQGEESKARAYAAYVDGIKAYVDAQRVAVEAYGEQVKSNNMILQGWAIEWDAYLKRLKPAELRIQAHEASSSHFGRLVQNYQAKAQAEGTRVESDIKVEQLHLAHMDSEIKKFQTLWAGIQTKLDALTKAYATDAQVYGARVDAESKRVTTLNQQYLADIEAAKLDFQSKAVGLQTRLGYWDRWMQTWVQWNAASAGAYAQLGAAAYSAMNYSLTASGGVSFNESLGNSYSTSENHNYTHTA